MLPEHELDMFKDARSVLSARNLSLDLGRAFGFLYRNRHDSKVGLRNGPPGAGMEATVDGDLGTCPLSRDSGKLPFVRADVPRSLDGEASPPDLSVISAADIAI